MPKLAGINHLNAIRAFEKAGYSIVRQGKHVVLVIPRQNPINAYTMGNIVRDAGMTNDEFRKLL